MCREAKRCGQNLLPATRHPHYPLSSRGFSGSCPLMRSLQLGGCGHFLGPGSGMSASGSLSEGRLLLSSSFSEGPSPGLGKLIVLGDTWPVPPVCEASLA